MPRPDRPCLSIAIARLRTSGANHFATWVLQAPYPSGYVHHDCLWSETLSQSWQAWQEMFSPHSLPRTPAPTPQLALTLASSTDAQATGAPPSYSSRLMQHLGMNLWQWLFEGPLHTSLHESKGIAIGQNQPLRVRLDLREPDLIAIPWEIMQPQAGQPAISLSQQLLFSRTTSNVDPLPPLRPAESLNILLVLGEQGGNSTLTPLQLETEALALASVLNSASSPDANAADASVPSRVDTLIQPTATELISYLETGSGPGKVGGGVGPYNILFYAGHGMPGPDGGLLFLRPDTTLNGTELAQVLVRCRITLAVFNACWGAQPAVETLTATGNPQAIARSSLAEVLIHHGVPAVLGMRDSIADREAVSFIQAFAQALSHRMAIDQAVAAARQQLLTLYKFNQPAWTLPVLYMHPQFDGELIESIDDVKTELPSNSPTWVGRSRPTAYLRSQSGSPGQTNQIWPIRAALVRVGRQEDNDVVIREQWVSQKHAEIFCRNSVAENKSEPSYFLRDFSRYGTLILGPDSWQRIHHQEVLLQSGTQLKFGSSQGQTLEFIIEIPQTSDSPEISYGTN